MEASQLISDVKVVREPSVILIFENLLEVVKKIRRRESLRKIDISLK
jgi:hypothetical protein